MEVKGKMNSMYEHVINFDPVQLRLLQDQHLLLFRHFEGGQGPREQYLAMLKKTMQEMLLRQSGLTHFWSKVYNEPKQYHHLHLVYKEKELLNLPWQMAVGDDNFSQVYISKGTAPVKAAPLEPATGPLQLLVMISSPDDLDLQHRLSHEYEVDVIRRALAPLLISGQVQMDITADGSLATLQRMLENKKYHVLYFSGHGVYKANTGYLLLEENNAFKCQMVKAQNFGRVLLRKKDHVPSLVVLASCQTAAGNSKNGLRGVADQLIHIGIPSVIAMAASVQDQYATLFAEALFGGLVNKQPLPIVYGKAIKEMKEAEQAAYVANGRTDSPVQWLLPQLYCNRKVDHIIDWDGAGSAIKNAADAVKIIHGGGRFLFMNHNENYFFIGRRREIARVQNVLGKNKPVLLKGEGGVGKTAMAEEVVRRLISEKQADQFFAFDETAIGIHVMIGQLEEYLEEQHQYRADLEELSDSVEKLNLLVECVADRCKPIWVFDHMDFCQQYPSGPIKKEYHEWLLFVKNKLINRFPVIFTCRYTIPEMADVIYENLGQVKIDEFYLKCCQLYMREIDRINPAITFENAVSILFTSLGGNYRALELFDEIYKKRPEHIGTLLEKLQNDEAKSNKEDRQLKKIASEIERQLVKEGSKLLFSELLQLLNETEGHVLHLLTHFRKPVLPLAIKKQNGIIDVEKVLQRLHDISLVEMLPGNFYYITPFVKDWLASHPMAVVHFSHKLAGEYFLNVKRSVGNNNIDNLEESFFHYLQAGDIDKLNQVGLRLTDYFYEISMLNKVLHYASLVETNALDQTDVFVLNHLAKANMAKGNYDEAIKYFEKVLFLSRHIKNKALEGSVFDNLSVIYMRQEDFVNAQAFNKKSTAITKTEGVSNKELCTRLNSRAFVWLRSGSEVELEFLKGCLSLAMKSKFAYGEAVALSNLGLYYQFEGNWDTARNKFAEGLSRVENLGDSDIKAELLFNIACIYNNKHEDDQTIKCLEHSLLVYQNIGHKQGEANALNLLGSIYVYKRNKTKALALLTDSLAIRRDLKSKIGLSSTLHNLAQAYAIARDKRNALKYGKECLSLMEETGGVIGSMMGYHNLAAVCNILGDKKGAKEFIDISLSIKESKGRLGLGLDSTIKRNLAAVSADDGNYEAAIETLIESAREKEAEGSFIIAATTCQTIASFSLKIKKYQDYIDYMVKAFVIFESIKWFEGMYSAGKEVGYFLTTGNLLNDETVVLQFHGNNGPVNDKTKDTMKMLGLSILERCVAVGHAEEYNDVTDLEEFVDQVKKGEI